ncbi:MAG: hypothetical protein QOH92_1943 [Chloroflexota bacterium]|jgi:hypothetical protein|nr:hypothetical protein [Chloroflexota bacterium]
MQPRLFRSTRPSNARLVWPLRLAVATLLAVPLVAWPAVGRADASSPIYSGRAYVVQASVLGTQLPRIADTGDLPSSGGAQEASLLTIPPISLGSAGSFNGAEVAHATTVGQGGASRSEASVASLSLTVVGTTITADFLMSRAAAQCSGSSPSVSGSSELATLSISSVNGGQPITVTGAPNQTIVLPPNAGTVVINEQSSSVSGQSGSMDVNALHVTITNPAGGPPLTDVIVSHAHADITCPTSPSQPPPCDTTPTDFVTGGGWIVSPSDPNAKANFAVAGGVKNGFWGHLLYIDHGNGMRVKGTGVTGYNFYPTFGSTGRQILGSADVSGTADSYEADVADNGEPGIGVDQFQLKLNGALVAPAALLSGGNIQLHKACQ